MPSVTEGPLLAQPRFQIGHNGRALSLTHTQALPGAQAGDGALDVEQHINALEL